MENYGFCIAENMKNADTEWRFLGDHQKRLYFKFMLFLTFAQKWKSILEKGIPGNIFLQNQKNRKKCYHESKRRFFSILGRQNLFNFLIMLFPFSYFPPHHRKWALLKKCIFHHSGPVEKVTFLKVLIFDVGTGNTFWEFVSHFLSRVRLHFSAFQNLSRNHFLYICSLVWPPNHHD